MDLNTVSSFVALKGRDDLGQWKPGSKWLAGGTFLFSQPQLGVETLLDLSNLGWPPIVVDDTGVTIAATCTFAQLYGYAAWPTEFVALSLVEPCCRALLGSFKVWNAATVGGNICLALPAGPMTAFATALDGIALLWTPEGGERRMPIKDFVVGVTRTALAPGEILRAIELPAATLRRRAAHRRVSLSVGGRSAALLVGTMGRDDFALTITGSTRHPIRLDFVGAPSSTDVRAAIDERLTLSDYHDDVHGRPVWRQHLTRALAEEIRVELLDGACA